LSCCCCSNHFGPNISPTRRYNNTNKNKTLLHGSLHFLMDVITHKLCLVIRVLSLSLFSISNKILRISVVPLFLVVIFCLFTVDSRRYRCDDSRQPHWPHVQSHRGTQYSPFKLPFISQSVLTCHFLTYEISLLHFFFSRTTGT
jgi:hypothetical protein